jgi:hypothetical protein
VRNWKNSGQLQGTQLLGRRRHEFSGLRVALVGPLPPPAGGMANQTRRPAGELRQEGASVELVQVNAPYRPAWIGRVQGLRAVAPAALRFRPVERGGRADIST